MLFPRATLMSAIVPTRVSRCITGTGWPAAVLVLVLPLMLVLVLLLLLLLLPPLLPPLLLLLLLLLVVVVVVDVGVRVMESGLGFPCPSTGT